MDLEFLKEAQQLQVMGGKDVENPNENNLTFWIGCGKRKWKDCSKYCAHLEMD